MRDIPPRSRWRDKANGSAVLALFTTPAGNGRAVVFRPDGEEAARSTSRTRFLQNHDPIEGDSV